MQRKACISMLRLHTSRGHRGCGLSLVRPRCAYRPSVFRHKGSRARSSACCPTTAFCATWSILMDAYKWVAAEGCKQWQCHLAKRASDARINRRKDMYRYLYVHTCRLVAAKRCGPAVPRCRGRTRKISEGTAVVPSEPEQSPSPTAHLNFRNQLFHAPAARTQRRLRLTPCPRRTRLHSLTRSARICARYTTPCHQTSGVRHESRR